MRQVGIFIIFYLILNYNIVKSSEVTSEKPIIIRADKVEYSIETEEIQAEGSVSLNFGDLELKSEILKAWLGKGELWAKGEILIIQDERKMSGEELNYNWKENKGDIIEGRTSIKNILLFGERIKFSPEISEIEKSQFTTCNLSPPHYHLSAKKVLVYPNKVVAKKVSLWVRNNRFINLPYLMVPLSRKGEERRSSLPLPRIGIDREDKIFIYGRWQNSLGEKYLYEIDYYGSLSSPFLINFSLKKGEGKVFKIGKTRLKDREYKNVTIYYLPTIIWEKKWKEVNELLIQGGKIEEDSKTKSDYLGIRLTLKKDKINLKNRIFNYLTYEISGNQYWYNNKDRFITSFLLSLGKEYKERLNFNLGYQERRESGDTPFRFDKIDLTQELKLGIYYRVNKDNTISIQSRYDLKQDSIYSTNYTWEKIWHCFKTKFTYYQYQKTLEGGIDLVGW